MTLTIPPFRELLRRPGTQLLAIVLADTLAYVGSHAGTSAMTVMAYLLQMMLVYRLWSGANMIPWMLLAMISCYEAFCVYVVYSKGAAGHAPVWVAAHTTAVVVTGLVLTSPTIRKHLRPLRGRRPV